MSCVESHRCLCSCVRARVCVCVCVCVRACVCHKLLHITSPLLPLSLFFLLLSRRGVGSWRVWYMNTEEPAATRLVYLRHKALQRPAAPLANCFTMPSFSCNAALYQLLLFRPCKTRSLNAFTIFLGTLKVWGHPSSAAESRDMWVCPLAACVAGVNQGGAYVAWQTPESLGAESRSAEQLIHLLSRVCLCLGSRLSLPMRLFVLSLYSTGTNVPSIDGVECFRLWSRDVHFFFHPKRLAHSLF